MLKKGFTLLLFCFSATALWSQSWRRNADSLLQAYRNEQGVQRKTELLSKASLVLLFQKPDTAFLLSTEAVKIAEAANDDVAKATAYASLSAVYVIRDDNEQTLNYALKALHIGEQTTLPPDLMASIYRKLGYVYRNQNKDQQSIDVYKRSIAYSVQSNNLHDQAATASNLGQIFVKIKQPDSALYYHQYALRLAKQGGFADIIVRCYINIVNVYDSQKNGSKSLTALREMLPYVNSSEVTPIVKGLAYTTIADQDLRRGNSGRQLAAQYLDSMQRLMRRTEPGTENKVDYYLNRALLEFSRGNEDSARAALEAFHQYKKISDDEIIAGHAQDLAVRYETGKKEEQIKSLAEESRLRQLLLTVFVIASLLFLFFSVWVVRQNRRIKKQEVKLSSLMKELHHRVKNNLQIVSSLLSLQSGKTKDEGAQKALQEGQYRIEAMSLIHRKLYQTEDVSGVAMKEFVTELSESLMHAYGYNHHNFQLNLNIQVERLDADTAIPLGLILNEVITNAFKYAYRDVKQPSLRIDLVKTDSAMQLRVTDNGLKFSSAQWQQSFSFGKQLIQSLVKQMKGSMELQTGDGTSFVFTLPPNTTV